MPNTVRLHRVLATKPDKVYHFCRGLVMRSSEPKPHEINKLLMSFDSEVRKRGCRIMMRTSESGHQHLPAAFPPLLGNFTNGV